MDNKGFSDIHKVAEDIKSNDSIVLYRDIGGVGDAVMITGAITALRRKFGNSVKIVVATIPYCAPVFFNNPDVDWIVDSSKFDRIHVDGAIDYGSGKEICKSFFEKYGAVFVGLSHPCPSAVYEASNEPNIIRSRQDLFVEACGVEYEKGDCKIYLTDDELEQARKSIPFNDYVVFHTRSNSKYRDLTKVQVDALSIELSKRLKSRGMGLVLVSHDWEWKFTKYDNILNLIKTPLRLVMSVIARSKLLVGVDSMGIHIAGALRIPVFGIFGSTDPKMRLAGYYNTTWYDKYKKCKRKPCWYHPCIFRFCMKTINLEDLADDVIWFMNVNDYIKLGEV